MSSKLKTIGFFTLCFAFGLSLFFSISEELMIQRDPAALNGKVFQLSAFSSEQIKHQLINKIKIQPATNHEKVVRLDGISSAICKTYSTIEMTFVADGVAVAGEPPEMTVKAPCLAAQDPANVASVMIPVDKILAEKTRNAEFHFDGNASRFEFKNSSDEWPRIWILKTVSFKSLRTSTKVVHLRTPDTRQDQLVVLEF